MAIAFAMFAWLPSSLNLLSVGADAAAARGVDVGRTQRLAFVSASLATAAAVSLAGPIGFVGIVVPHLVRLIVGVDHRIVLPASALFGAAFLVACDLVARTLLAPVEIPVGVVTAHDRRAVLPMAAGPKRLIGARPRRRGRSSAVRASRRRRQHALRPAAQRIVSLVPALTEMLFAIGAGPQVVGVSSYDEFPPEVKSLPKVGALLDPDIERILALRPDLVVDLRLADRPAGTARRAQASGSSATGTAASDRRLRRR